MSLYLATLIPPAYNETAVAISLALRPRLAARVRSMCIMSCGKSSCTSKSTLPILSLLLKACRTSCERRPISSKLLPVKLNCNFSERWPRAMDDAEALALTPGIVSNSFFSIFTNFCWLILRSSLGLRRTLMVPWLTCPREPAPIVAK